MCQIEIFTYYDEQELAKALNYFLNQIEDYLIKDVKYSSFPFFENGNLRILYSVLVIYVVR